MEIKSVPAYSLMACLLALPMSTAAAQPASATQPAPAVQASATDVPAASAVTKEGEARAETPTVMNSSASGMTGENHLQASKAAQTEAGTAVAEEKAKSVPAARSSQGNIEVQLEYLDARFFEKRDVNLYNIHVYHQYRTLGALSLHYGLTLERALGSTMEDDIYRDAEAVGFGPSYMMRWTRHVSSKLDASLDATGSVLAYNHAHPGNGRAFGFLWRIGPRLTYHYTDRDAVSLAYIFHHSSNGFSSHNPGYNGVGFSLGFTHNF